MANLSGQQLGKYRLIRQLAQGSFGDVYLGEHVHLATLAAIKVLRTSLVNQEVDQFLNEARTIARLNHPHIIRVFDFDVESNTPFLVMDYAPHGTLRQRHPAGTRLELMVIINYVKQIADALQYAHDSRVIHRDIKPENMLIGQRYEILLSDFGIAILSQSSRYQSTREMAGTIGYMAPEQIQGKPRPASDQYALGIIVYEWLSGRRPFHGTISEVAVQHSVAPPPPLRQVDPSISPEVERIVMKALSKEPQQRYEHIRDFAAALEQESPPATLIIPPPPPPPTLFARSANDQGRGQPSLSPNPTPPPPPPPVSARSASDQGKEQPSLPATAQLTDDQGRRQASTPLPPRPQTGSSPQLPAAPTRSRISRRVVIVGLVGLAVVGAASAAGIAISHGTSPFGSLTPTRPAGPSPTPTPNLPLVYLGHSQAVYAVTWAPDGKRIASGSWDKTVQVWNPLYGRSFFSYLGHSGHIWCCKWSPDGKYIASGGEDKTVQVWDASNGHLIYTFRGHHDWVCALAWSPDSLRIASGSGANGLDKTVQVWNASDGSNVYVYKGHSDAVRAVAWSPDGTRIASGGEDNTVQIWNASNGGSVLTYQGHTATVRAIAWSPDGIRIASGSDDQTVQIWEAFRGTLLLTYRQHRGAVWTVAWSPDGKNIASGGEDNVVQVWNALDGTHFYTYSGHNDAVRNLAWSPDEKLIASGSEDRTVQVWQAPR